MSMCCRHAAKRLPRRNRIRHRHPNTRRQFTKRFACTVYSVSTYRPNEIRENFLSSSLFQVGRALAPSILDLTDSNPLTRLRNSEFRSLQGLRNSLRNDIDRNAVGPRNSAAMSKVSLTFHAKSNFDSRFSVFILIFVFRFDVWPKESHRSGHRRDAQV